MTKHMLGWNKQLPDHRDHLYLAAPEVIQNLPLSVDLRGPNMPEPYDQGQISSCTANAIAGAIQFDRRKNNQSPDFVPSRLFIYYNERLIEHTTRMDAGANLRDGIKAVVKAGACDETLWTYDDLPADPNSSLWPRGARPAKKPTKAAYKAALNYQTISYKAVAQNLTQMKGCLAEGFPIILGITVYNSLWDQNGNPQTHLPFPSSNDRVEGGHAILAVGFSDSTNEFIMRNSWGKNVQDGGYFYIPYEYLTNPNLASDFWTIRQIEA